MFIGQSQHEKQVITDWTRVLICSENASVASLDYNRELSLELNSRETPAMVASVIATFNADYAASPSYRES